MTSRFNRLCYYASTALFGLLALLFLGVFVTSLAKNAVDIWVRVGWAWRHTGNYVGLLVGFVAYGVFAISLATFRISHNLKWFMKFTHELTHTLVALFFFKKISEFVVRGKECYVNYKMGKYGIGYTTITTTTKIPLTIDDLKPYLKDKISVIAGQSGVGKSSILNIIDENIKMDTNEISKALNRGKHTTRYTKLFNVYDGWIADSPGFGTMELDSMDEVSVSHSFIEFFELSKNCKYNGCLHINEPHCNVKKALEEKKILQSRYDNYLHLVKEIKDGKQVWRKK